MLLLGHKMVQNAHLLNEVLQVSQQYSPINSERVKLAVKGLLGSKHYFSDMT